MVYLPTFIYLNLPWKINHSCRYCKYTIFPWMILDQKSPEGQMFYWPFGEKFVGGSFFVFAIDLGVSENSGTHKSSILMRFSIINHPFWGTTIFGNVHLLTIMNFHTLIKIQVSMYLPAVGYRFENAPRYIHETLCDLHQMAKAFQGTYLDTSQGIFCQTKLTGSLDVLIYTHCMCIVQTFCRPQVPLHDCCHCWFLLATMPTKCMTFHLHSF